MYIDTHCHLTLPEFDDDRTAVIGNAKKAGVKQMIVPGVNLLSSRQATKLADGKHLFAAIGFHPYEAQDLPDMTLLPPLLGDNVVAIGECGLDYHLYKGEQATSKKENQRRLFKEHIELALTYQLPLIMHCRDAFDDYFAIMAQYPEARGVVHCFSGSRQDLRLATNQGLFIGIDGNVTFSPHVQSIISDIPLASLLLETDAPYLTPIPHRGKRNEPKYVPIIAEFIAQTLSITKSDVANQTTLNAQTLFKLI